MDATAKADPFRQEQKRAELCLDIAEHAVEQREIGIFAVVVDHETADPIHDLLDLVDIPFAEAGERPGWIGKVETGRADHRIETQAAHDARGLVGKPFQLADGVEDDLVGMGDHVIDLVIGIGHGVGMGLLAEALVPQTDFVQRGRGGAIHVVAHEVEHTPGGKALERQQGLGAGLLAYIGDLLHVAEKLCLVDQIIGCVDHLSLSPSLPAAGGGHVDR